jgi:hypothetical protein
MICLVGSAYAPGTNATPFPIRKDHNDAMRNPHSVSLRDSLELGEVHDWDDAKNAKLRAERGIGFEDTVFHIERGDLLDILEHPNPIRYAGRRIFVVRRED